MNRFFFTLVFSALTLGAVLSCTKDHGQIDSFDDKLVAAEGEKVVSIANQIADVNASISDLAAIRARVKDLTEEYASEGKDVTDLKAADQSLGDRIGTLQSYLDNELTKYAEMQTVAATYATLSQYNAASNTIRGISAKIGTVGGELAKKLEAAADSMNEVMNRLEASIIALTGRVDALERRVQAVTVIPAWSDGSVDAKNGIVLINCIISPAASVSGLTKDNFSILLNKSGNLNTVRITNDGHFVADAVNGIVAVMADISTYTPAADEFVSVAVRIKNDISDYTTEFVPVEFSSAAE